MEDDGESQKVIGGHWGSLASLGLGVYFTFFLTKISEIYKMI
jgi:hypothetical protein